MKYILTCLTICLCSQPLQAKTLPNDIVNIINTKDYNKNPFTLYPKAFKQLKLSPTIKKLIEQLDKDPNKDKSSLERMRLSRIRIVGDEVQVLVFSNTYGDLQYYSLLKNKIDMECNITLTGNGWSNCSQHKH